ncbi:universal stress protein [Mumia sp. zg.B53]|uniref:universal stress protein n=1 Tax=unclassified Mumia TaxID=2621872 RepID=UPI001C6F305E|nr:MULTISPECIES: universal stress protein [unclassified Mumia]MBW9207620.1 universal stress protein [Mumia sp. zg.B17]MBW9210034.1 universal stress protein [Mumia sp. zg.B21]MBW9214638.1 universal stress protein [Mumia sp. zg.B53]MDD9348891.1 universal stress protein [Mumia sp.]
MTTKEIDFDGGILVGHDGSDFSDQAVEWALEYGRLTGQPVTVTRAWVLTTAPRPKTWEPGYMPPLEDFAAAVVEVLDDDLAPLRAKYPEVDVRTCAVHGKPATRIIEASEKASTVVVGRRGLGGFKGLLLGSVSEQVVRHAKATVVVINPSGGDESPDARNVLDSSFSDDA